MKSLTSPIGKNRCVPNIVSLPVWSIKEKLQVAINFICSQILDVANRKELARSIRWEIKRKKRKRVEARKKKTTLAFGFAIDQDARGAASPADCPGLLLLPLAGVAAPPSPSKRNQLANKQRHPTKKASPFLWEQSTAGLGSETSCQRAYASNHESVFIFRELMSFRSRVSSPFFRVSTLRSQMTGRASTIRPGVNIDRPGLVPALLFDQIMGWSYSSPGLYTWLFSLAAACFVHADYSIPKYFQIHV